MPNEGVTSGGAHNYAHTPNELSSGEWQLLRDHLYSVAKLARRFAEPLGFKEEAELAGLLHDFGKFRPEFQAYLRGQRAKSKETQHAIYGAAWALYPHKQVGTGLAVAGHHAGLHDLCDLLAVPRISENVISDLIRMFENELGKLPPFPGIPDHIQGSGPEAIFAVDIYVRMLFSCLVDADRLDTACWPNTPPADKLLDAGSLLARLAAERERIRSGNAEDVITALRNRVFDACLDAGRLEQGFFSLTVPTGGGKTLAAMNFALAHAKAHSLRRVIVVIPYLSIIEQNAAVYRRVLGDVVAEIHSAAESQTDVDEEEKSRLDLVSENWDAPVIVTTSVQFIESLFAASPSKCRKVHRIAHSVVLFDEVQTLPHKLLKPILSAFRELARNYRVSFVFSSATQPAFRKSEALPDGFDPGEMREIAPEPKTLFRALRRVNYRFPRSEETIDWPTLAERLFESPQVLCVVNLIAHAKTLWGQLKDLLPEGQRPFHLSSSMCPAHRLDSIAAIRDSLRLGLPCRVVSTQLVEAGVDLDFPVVWRALGPLDSIVQVAGRCNREGKLDRGEVNIFRPTEHKLPKGIYRIATDQTSIALSALGDETIASESLATDPDVFRRYFGALYQVVNTDHAKQGESTIQEDRENLRFRQVSRKAKVIEDSGQPVIVSGDDHGHPYGKECIEELRNRKLTPNEPRFTRDDLRRLQRFMVNVRSHRFSELAAMHGMQPLLPNFELFVLEDGLYHSDLGLVIENRPLEDFIQ